MGEKGGVARNGALQGQGYDREGCPEDAIREVEGVPEKEDDDLKAIRTAIDFEEKGALFFFLATSLLLTLGLSLNSGMSLVLKSLIMLLLVNSSTNSLRKVGISFNVSYSLNIFDTFCSM